MTVLFTNPLGIKFERTDYKKRSKVKVHCNGYNHRIYRFNNVPCFESPYISWENLDCCGGWATKDDYIESAVYNRTKLFAQIVHHKDKSFEQTIETVVVHDPTPRGYNDDYRITYIASKLCLHEYYELDEVFEHYSRLGIEFTDREKELIDEYCAIPLWMFATEEAPYSFVRSSEVEELVVTGLLLGYPLESTASIIEEWYL